MKRDIVEIYKECGNFHQAVKESGLPALVAHVKLLSSGVLKIQDKIKYGSESAKLGGKAEELFQKLVPEAVDANKYWQQNNPKYDFMYKNMTIDVKFSSCYKSRKSKNSNARYWTARCNGTANLYVLFLENEENTDKEKKLENPYILIIPNGFLHTKESKHLTKGSVFFTDFQVKKDELNTMLDEYAGALGELL
jgi:hypothetical protein F3_00947